MTAPSLNFLPQNDLRGTTSFSTPNLKTGDKSGQRPVDIRAGTANDGNRRAVRDRLAECARHQAAAQGRQRPAAGEDIGPLVGTARVRHQGRTVRRPGRQFSGRRGPDRLRHASPARGRNGFCYRPAAVASIHRPETQGSRPATGDGRRQAAAHDGCLRRRNHSDRRFTPDSTGQLHAWREDGWRGNNQLQRGNLVDWSQRARAGVEDTIAGRYRVFLNIGPIKN